MSGRARGNPGGTRGMVREIDDGLEEVAIAAAGPTAAAAIASRMVPEIYEIDGDVRPFDDGTAVPGAEACG